jgi:hypothetical protein
VRNRIRSKRDRASAGDRALVQSELSAQQKKVRRRLEVVRSRTLEHRNKTLLDCNSKNPTVYWNLLKQAVGLRRKKVVVPEEVLFEGVVVTGDNVLGVWKEAFRRIFAIDADDKAFRMEKLEEIQQEVRDEMAISRQFDDLNDDLNRPIVSEEVLGVIGKLKQGKAAGVDTIVYEIFKYGGEGIGQATARLCEEIFRLERVPKDWARGLIFPLYKDGDNRIPENYRGVTLLSVVGKIYTSVLNARVTSWCEKYGVLSEEQAGFRPGRSTSDHIFSISEVLKFRRSRGKQTHCAFLDIKKAYDSVHRDALWKRLIDVGIRGKMWRVLKNIYDVVESCVIVGQRQTEWFTAEAGVRQGCLLSPIMFAIFIEGLARKIKQVKVASILQGVRFNLTLFADDIALLAGSKRDLQKLLDAAFEYSEDWRFKWNCSKSKVMCFGPVKNKSHNQYFLGLQQMEVVTSFKFLGVDLQQNLSWASTKKRFASKARSRIPLVKKAMIEELSVQTGEKLWMTMVRPLLEYAVEVWGGGDWVEADRIQNLAGRTLLGLHKNTAVEAIRGDLGWPSMKARRDLKMLKYWGKLLHMDDSRLVKQIYRHCKTKTAGLKTSFCHHIRNLLISLNLEHIWLSEKIGNHKDWSKLAETSVNQRDANLWSMAMQKKSSLRLYRVIKSALRREEYTMWGLAPDHRSCYARIRSGSLHLRIRTGSWNKEPEKDRVCQVCLTGKVENESHFLLQCYAYDRLREFMFRQIKLNTGYDLDIMKDDSEWLLEVLIGHGLASKVVREKIGKAVAAFLVAAMRVRRSWLA